MYSDIAVQEDVGAQLLMPDAEANNQGDLLRNPLIPNNQFRPLFPFSGIQSQQLFVDNGV